jgi:hypothetical protein
MTAPAIAYSHIAVGRVRIPPVNFVRRFADACRQIRRSASHLSESDSRLLTDLAEGKGLVRIERVADISARCSDLADATALSDAFRGHALALRRVEPITVLEAIRIEAKADGAEDAAVVEYLANPCEANRQRAIEALRRAAETTLAVVDALHQRGPAA